MNKLLTKIVGVVLGTTMAVGVGVGVAVNSERANVDSQVNATPGASPMTSTFNSKSWGVESGGDSWVSDKDGYQMTTGTGVQVTAAYSGAGATSSETYSNITSISVNAKTTKSGVGNITIKVGSGSAQTICSLSKQQTADDYELTYATPVSGKVTFVVNCSTNSMYLTSITITYSSSSSTPLEAPTNLAWDSEHSKVTWSASADAGGYKVSVNSGTWSEATQSLYYEISTSPSTFYNVQVKAVPSENDKTHSESTAASVSFDTLVGEGTLANPYTVADARAIIDSNSGLENQHVTGIVSEIVDSWSTQYNNISFNLSSDGETTSDQFEAWRCVSSTEHSISSDDDVEIGATVIVYGTLKKHNSTYEMDQGCKIVSYTAPTPIAKHTLTYAVGEHGVYDGSTDKEFEVAEGGKHAVLAADTVGITAESGFVFSGWNDGTNTYQPDDEYTMGESNVTLTALWEVYVDPSTYFTKITSTSDITDGKYAIVHSNLMFDGSRTTLDAVSNTKELTLQNILTSYFTISSGKVKSASGYYIGTTTDANDLKTSTSIEYENTVSIDENENLVVVSSGGAYLRYNNASNQLRFRYYKSATYSGQQAIQLYKVNYDKVFEDAITCTGDAGTHTFNMGMSWKANGTNLSLENLYNTLSTNDKANLSSATFAKYDYIVGKYNPTLDPNSAYKDFMGRNPAIVGGANVNGLLVDLNATNVATIVVVTSIISLTTISGYFLLRKRKEEK